MRAPLSLDSFFGQVSCATHAAVFYRLNFWRWRGTSRTPGDWSLAPCLWVRLAGAV